ncbi:MAG: phage shock protein operon transcriptional activator [Gammaproteobacteria bacterium]|nr:phage shock protein operon transcriptional activator [Gammaproteobacteria bacterium]MDH5345245.1 phage shock protein operon transcriptional activator [Gammaproteobacteria bacterium]
MNADRPTQPIIGEAPVFLEMLEHVSRAAPLSKPVLVVGERGTGKELIAARLHFLSKRWGQPLVKVNCAALTESILESELFGHEAGAFTGAARQHIGHFERADSGTLVLDELATIPQRTQEKILRVIEYGELQRVGGSETISVDVRIVGATNADLQTLVADGRFREDLLDRLAFDVITVPPLRERAEDVLPLAYAFAMNMVSELELPLFPGFGARATSSLIRHDWPGNVRELKNVVERSVYRQQGEDKQITEIAFDPFDSPFRLRTTGRQTPSTDGQKAVTRRHLLPVDLKERIAETERELVIAALDRAKFNQRVAAQLLGLTYHQLRGKIRKHALDVRRPN